MERKILFTASTFSHIQNFHLPYLAHYAQRGWTVHVACGGEERPVPWADRVISLPLEKQMYSPGNFRAAAALRRLIAAEGYTLISTHTSLAAFFTRLAVKGLRQRPLLLDIDHGYLFDDSTPRLKREILLTAERMTAPETDLLMTMNLWDYQLAQRYRLGRRVVHIPGMGVDFSKLDGYEAEGPALREAWGIPTEAFVLLYPAEFSRRKSQEVLLRAMTELPDEAVLVLPGSGALLEACRRQADQLGLSGRVVFPGQVQGMGRWYAAADAAVTSSRSEGLPFNVMEAMYCGLPVAASAVKGHTDLIAHGETGLLYPYGDSAACASAVRQLMASPQLRRELGQAARERVERYALDRVLPEVTAQMDALTGEAVPV